MGKNSPELLKDMKSHFRNLNNSKINHSKTAEHQK